RHRLLASQGDISNLVIATIVSGLIGYATIAFLLGYLKRHSTYLFIIYRLALGATLLLLLSTGLLVDDPPAKQPGPATQAAVSTCRRELEVRPAPPQADWRSVFAPGL